MFFMNPNAEKVTRLFHSSSAFEWLDEEKSQISAKEKRSAVSEDDAAKSGEAAPAPRRRGARP
ncbi:MAG: hypothetical protein AAFS03_11350 [Pseudomonadota bacterium]